MGGSGHEAFLKEILSEGCLLPNPLVGGKTMFLFKSKFLRPTAAPTIVPDAPTGDAVKTATTTAKHLHSRLLLERQRRAKNELQRCVRCR
jgi:hypothetical protein